MTVNTSTQVEIGDVYRWAGKQWRVTDIVGKCARIVNVENADNKATMPLTQFKNKS